MFPFFHTFVPLIFLERGRLIRKLGLHRFYLVIGLMLPDMLDKPLVFILDLSGRTFFHSLTFLGLMCLITYCLRHWKEKAMKQYRIFFALTVGVVIHMILDLPALPFFSPFIDYSSQYPSDPVGSWLDRIVSDPFTICTELMGIGAMIVLIVQLRLFKISAIRDYLFADTETGESRDAEESNETEESSDMEESSESGKLPEGDSR